MFVFRFHQQMEGLFVLLIITVLCALAVNEYVPLKSRATLMSFSGHRDVMIQSQVYYSTNGTWPENREAFNEAFFLPDTQNDPFISRTILSDGAIHFFFKGSLAGKVLTLHPAIYSENPTGPVMWIAGDTISRKDWLVSGEDKTTVDPVLINRELK